MLGEIMKEEIRNRIYQFTVAFELVVTIIIGIVLAFQFIKFIPYIIQNIFVGYDSDFLLRFLEESLNFVIGIEFIKMLFKHSTNNVIEVLLFAIARHIVVCNTSSIDTLCLIIAVAILFAMRKFLLYFNYRLKKTEKNSF